MNKIEQRVSDAEKLGFNKIIISSHYLKGLQKKTFSIEIVAPSNSEEVLSLIFA